MPANKPLRFTDRWRKRLASAVADVGWKRLAEITTVAKAGTICQWHQLMLKVKLGIPITLSPRTVAAILDRHGLKPAPVRGTDSTWKTFISEHMNELAATDFFTVDVWGLLGKTSHDVLFAGRSYHGR